MADELKILQYPNEYLDKPTKAVPKVTPELVETAKHMYKVMREAGGIGLAANQVGLDISLIVLENDGRPLIMFNPTILQRSKEQEYQAEGCLSFAGVYRTIKRPLEVTVKYRDENNKMQHCVLKGLQARCMVHEYDHILGKTFLQYEEKA